MRKLAMQNKTFETYKYIRIPFILIEGIYTSVPEPTCMLVFCFATSLPYGSGLFVSILHA